MTASGAQLCIREIAVGAFGESSVPEGSKGKFLTKASLRDYLLYHAAQIAQVFAWGNPWKRGC